MMMIAFPQLRLEFFQLFSCIIIQNFQLLCLMQKCLMIILPMNIDQQIGQILQLLRGNRLSSNL